MFGNVVCALWQIKTWSIQPSDTLCTCCMSLVCAAVGHVRDWSHLSAASQCRDLLPLTPSNAAIYIRLTLANGATREDFIRFLWTFTALGTEWDMIQCCEDNADTAESSQAGDTGDTHSQSHRQMSPNPAEQPLRRSIFSRHKTCEVTERRELWQAAWHVTRKFSVPVLLSHSSLP